MNPSIRRPLFVALLVALFALALGVGLAASSSGGEATPAKRVGSAAVPLDVPAAAGAAGLAEAVPLPPMARKPEPPPEEPVVAPEPPVESVPEEPVAPEPVPAEPLPAPAPDPPPPPPEPAPPLEFDDEG